MEVETQQNEISDLVKLAYEDQPAKMQDVFNELMMGRVQDSIDQRKYEIAQRFFDSAQDVGYEEDYEEQEEEDLVDGQNS